MSNELAMLDTGLPSYLKELELDDVTKSLMGGGSGGIKRISIKGGVWRMMVNGKEIAKNEERSMNVVIVNAAPKVSRTFYLKQYSEVVTSLHPTAGLPMVKCLMLSRRTLKPSAVWTAPRTSKVRAKATAVLAATASVWPWCWPTTSRVTCSN